MLPEINTHETDCPPECPCSGGRGEEGVSEVSTSPGRTATDRLPWRPSVAAGAPSDNGKPGEAGCAAAAVLGGVSSTSADSGPGGKGLGGQGRCSVSDSLLLKVLASIRLAARRLQGPELGKK